MQRNYGIPGLIASELMFLLVAVLYCLLRRVKLSEMFPVKKITAAEFFGVVILAAAGFLFSMVGVGVSLSILPIRSSPPSGPSTARARRRSSSAGIPSAAFRSFRSPSGAK